MNSPLATPSATREVLERHGLALKKSLGQNFLVNDAIIGKIIALADVQPDDVVLEVGPGIGTLTYALLERARAVIAIERDPALPPVLGDTLADHADRFLLIEKDALDVTREDLRGFADERLEAPLVPSKFVANLPYAVAATVVLGYFQNFESIQSATVMVQREVAERMMAKPGSKNYGAYTVKLSMFAEPAGSFAVAQSNFMPPPHVDSTVLRLNRISTKCEAISAANMDATAHSTGVNTATPTTGICGVDASALVKAACTMADAAFFARRKTIANSCKQYFASRDPEIAAEVPQILKSAGIDPKTRGETLSKSDYVNLGKALLFTLLSIKENSTLLSIKEDKR